MKRLLLVFLMLSSYISYGQINDSIVAKSGPNAPFPLNNNQSIEQLIASGYGFTIIYPLLIVDNFIIRDEGLIDYFRNNVHRKDIKKVRALNKEEAEKKGIPNVPKDGVIVIELKKGHYLELRNRTSQ